MKRNGCRQLEDNDVVYYAAVSLDGFIADSDGGVGWLDGYFIPELGFHDFMARVGTTIMGRKTFDQISGFGKWPYQGKPGLIVTHGDLPETDAEIAKVEGLPDQIITAAKALGAGPYWVVGGANLAGQMLSAGALTRIDLFVIPELLGAGVPAFANLDRTGLELIGTQEYLKGTVRLSFRPRATT